METTAKIIIETTKGPLRFELWCKEFPIITRAFLVNCIQGKYNDLEFDVDDPLITVHGKDVKYDYDDEFHSRIRWNRRGLLGFCKDGHKKSSTANLFFISLTELPEYNGKFIVFGSILGDSFYNVVKIRDGEFAAKVTEVKIEEPYFEDLPEKEGLGANIIEKKEVKKRKIKVKVNYDDDEEEDFQIRSAHELLGRKKEEKVKEERVEKVHQKKESEEKAEPEQKAQSEEKAEAEEKKELNSSVEDVSHEKPTEVKTANLASQHKDTPSAESVGKLANNKIETDQPEKSQTKTQFPASSKKKRIRDRTIDPIYNAKLDLSSDEDFDMETLTSHIFNSRAKV